MKREFGNSNGVSQRLVYKRVKRSSSSKAVESNGGVAVGVSKGHDRVGSLNSLNEKEKDVNGVEKEEMSDVVFKGLCNEGAKIVGEVSTMEVEEKGKNGEEMAAEIVPKGIAGVEGNVGSGEVEKEKVMEETLSKLEVERSIAYEKGLCDERVENNNMGEFSTMEVEEKVENGEEKAVKIVPEGIVTEEGNDDNMVNGVKNVLEETSSKSPSKFGGERYQRRSTRSALKSNVVEEEVVEETVNVEKVNETMSDDCTKRVTRASLGKPKEDGPDSCLTETSDSVVPDKENVESGISNENRDCDMDKLVEDTGTMSATHRKLEMKMSEQIVVDSIPTTVRELFETGLLEGCPVYYDRGKGSVLRGRIRAIGICCPCNSCRGCKVIPPSMFEIHATNTYKRAVEYIYLENGRSFIQILKACKTTHLKTLEETVQNAIGPLPEKKVVVCQNCREPFLTLDAECSDPVCSSCVMSNLSPVGPVYSGRRLCRSSKFGTIPAASSCRKLRDRSLENTAFEKERSVKKHAESFVTPKMRSSSRSGRTSETKISEKAAERSKEVILASKACSSPVTGKSLATKSLKKLIKKPSKAALSPKPSKLTRVGKSSKIDGRAKITKRLRKEILTPKPAKTPSAYDSSQKKTSGKITRKDLRLHKLVFEDDVLPDGTELGYYARGKKLLDGFKKGSGIFCNCCETVVSASQFEAHAGCAAKRKPYCYIYTSNGVSLHELSINLIKGRRHSTKFNDDLCSICADGGNLLLCDGCPRAFHTECASLSSIPHGKWYCKYCENMFEREKFVAHNDNALAAGRVSGVDAMEQITKRSIRIVNNVESDVSSCILCRGFDFCKSGFGPRTIILCDQCEKEYHVGCLKDHDMADLTELPDGKWFCSLACGRIESAFQNLLFQGTEKLPESLLNIIRRKNLQNIPKSTADVDVSWRLLSGKIASPETRPLLSQAVAIFHESFAPIVEVVSGHDLIPATVYGRNVGGQEYGGMYCAVLTVNSVVVSAAIFRVFGPEVAELPLVATSSGNHGKGYFQALFACIEKILADLKVKTFVLPAAEEAESIWIDRFGFKKMTPDQHRQLKNNFWSLVRFQGTSMLHKSVPEGTIV